MLRKVKRGGRRVHIDFYTYSSHGLRPVLTLQEEISLTQLVTTGLVTI